MMVKLLFFAAAQEMVGQHSMELALDDDATIGDLKRSLAEQYPALTMLLEKSTISVDQEYADDQKQLYHNAEVGLIPPVSGG